MMSANTFTIIVAALLAAPCLAIPRAEDGRADAWRIVEAATGTQACTWLNAEPANGPLPWAIEGMDEGCHGITSAPGPHASVTDGFYPDGTREGDAWTNTRSEAEARTHRYGQQCSLVLDPQTAPMPWEEQDPARLTAAYHWRCLSTVVWHTDGGTVERGVVTRDATDLDDHRVVLSLTCGSTTDGYDSDNPGPFPQITVGSGGADCSLFLEVTGSQIADDGAVVGSEVRTGVQWWVPVQGGCGFGPELIALAPLLRGLRRRAAKGTP